MPPCVEPSVRSQGPVSISQEEGSRRCGSLTRPVGRRRILVQTDTGNVYGFELDRADNIQAIKRRLQALLHVPMDQAALICGDLILQNDSNDLKKDNLLLLTRKLQRSLSSPCLSPISEFQAEPGSKHVLEVVGGSLRSSKMRGTVQEIAKAVQCGVEPVPISGGLGGAYFFRNSKGENIAIIKPTDEEPLAPNNPKGYVGRVLGQHGLKKGVRVGETGVREVAAYLLDHENFAKVPPTVLVKITHHAFCVNSTTSGLGKFHTSVTKLASCQEFVRHDFDACDRGCSGYSVAAVHRIGILDIRIFNTDRHAGNILVKNVDVPWTRGSSWMHVKQNLELIPIDHGLCLPEFLEDPYFEWLHWPQASVAFSDDELDYIRRLDAKKDVDILRAELPMLRVACLRVLVLSTTFLQIAAAAGFCLAEIGALMGRDGLEDISQLEMFCLEARQEAESKRRSVTLEDDDFFSDKSHEDDDTQEQFKLEEDDEYQEHFKFEEDDQLSEVTTPEQFKFEEDDEFFVVNAPETLCYTHSGYSASHQAGFSASLTRKKKSMACNGLSADFEHANSLSRGKQTFSEDFCSSGRYFMSRSFEAKLASHSEALSLDKEDFLSLPAKQRTSCSKGGRVLSRAVSLLDSSGRSISRMAKLCCNADGTSRGSCPKDGVTQKAESINACQISRAPVKAMSFKSASLSDRKPRLKFLGNRGAFGVSASETHSMVNAAGSGSAFSFEDMSEQQWVCFMECFEQILQEDFASRCTEPVGYRQRLGVSLPAFHQTHFH